MNGGLTDTVVRAVAIDATTPTTLYVGTDGSGVFKTTDGGSSWNAASAGITAIETGVIAIAVDPTIPTTVYAGMAAGITAERGGLFKSTNGGGTWDMMNLGLTGTAVRALAIDRKTPMTLFAATDQGGSIGGPSGLFKSTDGGRSWRAASIEADAARDLQSLVACQDRLVHEGINLAAYTTQSLAADVRDVLHALGYRSWNLYGFSQSTRVAQVLMRDSPAGEIRSVVLDSAIPLAHIHLLDGAANYERLLRLISADCAADAACDRMYPDTARLAFDVISQLNAMPLTVRLTDPDSGERISAVFSGDRFVLTNSIDLQSAGVALVYPALVKSLARRLPTLLLSVDARLTAMANSALVYSVICDDQIPFMTPDALAAATQGVRPEIVHAFRAGFHDLDAAVCRVWTGSRPAPQPAAPVVSDIPTLILSGQYDPAAPPSLAAEVARTLSRSSILEFRGYGHGELYTFASAGAPNCAGRVMGEFFSHPGQPPDASCVAEIPPPRFLGT